MNNIIKLLVGDPSNDGHGKTESLIIDSNLSIKQLESAYKKGSKTLKFDLFKYCNDWEDAKIPFKEWKKLIDNGLDVKDFGCYDQIEEEFDTSFLYSLDYFTVYLFICKFGNNDFKYSITEEANVLNIGGYGLSDFDN